jgi:anti-sigma B factor antagonist
MITRKKMLITKTVNKNIVTLSIEGNMDTINSVQLSDELESIFSEGAFNINLDLKELNYISSSGLRVLLAAQKKAVSLGTKIELFGANDTVREVLRITGFSNILTVH